MAVRIACPNPDCGNVAEVEEQSLGKRGRCKKCGHVFALARPDGQPASMMSGDASAWKKGSTPASPTELPEQFGRYRIRKTLGQGGMGAVYLALDTKLDRQVALKVPFFNPQDGPQAVQRFEREARAVATLDHPNLCPIFDVGEVDGIHYLTMPYIQGKTLSDAISKDQTFTEGQAAAVVRKLALALQEAHEKGIIHRDLKPGNIMINRHRELIIMDFGLARVVDGDDKPITRTGHVLGTALYMAPEQAAGESAIGPAADVYSLGVILHELLTGRRPFEGPWSLVIGLKNVKDPEPPSKLRPDLSPALEAICLKAIARASKDRYATMAEFAGALTAFLAVPAPPVSPSGASLPAKSPESLAVQVFAGLITQEESSLRGEKSLVQPRPERAGTAPTRPPRRSSIAAAAGSVVVLLLGIIIYLTTANQGAKKNGPGADVRKPRAAPSPPKTVPRAAPAEVPAPPSSPSVADLTAAKEQSTAADGDSLASKGASTDARSLTPKATEKSAAGKQPATRGIAAQAFRPGSVWVSEGGKIEILAQDADRFTARLTTRTGYTIREIHGFVDEDRFRWRASDVVAIKGDQGGDNWGVVKGDELRINFSTNGGPVSTWSARLDRSTSPGAR